MPINPVGTTATGVSGAATGAKATTRTPEKTMGSEVFMSLLVTQLKNQDPSSPMDTGQMISQTTQLSMMEKINELAENSTTALQTQLRAASAALVGTTVSYRGTDGATATGTVDAVSFTGSDPTLTIGSTSVHYADLLGAGA